MKATDLVGQQNNNPILDTRLYDVEIPDGATKEYTANMIAEHIYSQVDAEGLSYALLDDTIGHQKRKGAISLAELMKANRTTTKGWELHVRWHDGSTDWIPLKDLKHSNPIEVS